MGQVMRHDRRMWYGASKRLFGQQDKLIVEMVQRGHKKNLTELLDSEHPTRNPFTDKWETFIVTDEEWDAYDVVTKVGVAVGRG